MLRLCRSFPFFRALLLIQQNFNVLSLFYFLLCVLSLFLYSLMLISPFFLFFIFSYTFITVFYVLEIFTALLQHGPYSLQS